MTVLHDCDMDAAIVDKFNDWRSAKLRGGGEFHQRVSLPLLLLEQKG